MSLQYARAICRLGTDAEVGDFLDEFPRLFLWGHDEDVVASWNRLEGQRRQPQVYSVWRGADLELCYEGGSTRVPLRGGADDRLILIHTLAQLVGAHSQIRFCRNSVSGRSAFLPLEPAEWGVLESELGAEVVARRFLRLKPRFDEFKKEAAEPAAPPAHKLVAAEPDWEGAPSFKPDALQWVTVASAPGRPHEAVFNALVERTFEPGVVLFHLRGDGATHAVKRQHLLERIAPYLAKAEIRMMNEPLTRFAVVEPDGSAAGWATEAAGDDAGGARPSRWRFWK